MSARIIKRDCRHPRARHEHGTTGGYWQDRCGCHPCTAAAHAYEVRRYRLRVLRRWPARMVNPVGARRRVEALAWVGWSQVRLAALLGMDETNLSRIIRKENRITAGNAAKIAALYDRLWDTQPPADTHGQRISVSKTRNDARRQGWAPPLAWDEGTIDDPAATPQHQVQGRHLATLHAEDRAEIVNTLTRARKSAAEIADLIGVATRTVVRDRSRGAAA